MTINHIWPCVRCTEEEYEGYIREKLHDLGFTDNARETIGSWSEFKILETKYYGSPGREIGNCLELENGELNYGGQYLCPNIESFLYNCREISILEGWFKGEIVAEKETTTETAEEIKEEVTTEQVEEQEEAEKLPCVRCTATEYAEQIRPYIRKYRYIDRVKCDWQGVAIIGVVGNFNVMSGDVEIKNDINETRGEYLCNTVAQFIQDAEYLAYSAGCYKPALPPTLAEARRQFRELTKHYTLAQLASSDSVLYENTGKFSAEEEVLATRVLRDLTKLRELGCVIVGNASSLRAYRVEDYMPCQPSDTSVDVDPRYVMPALELGTIDNYCVDDVEYFAEGFIKEKEK